MPHTVVEPVDTSICLHVIYTPTFVRMCAVNASVSVSKPFILMCVFTKAHGFSVIEHTQPVKTIRASELENVQAGPWDVKAIPDDTAFGLLRFSASWRPDTDDY